MAPPHRSHAPTRLVADGRLAVRVPAAWARGVEPGVPQSCVQALTLPVLSWGRPARGTVRVLLGMGSDDVTDPAGSSSIVVDGLTIEQHLHDEANEVQVDRVDLVSHALGGSICREGDRPRAHAVVRQVGRPSKGDPLRLHTCEPMVGEVLPLGSDVHVTFST